MSGSSSSDSSSDRRGSSSAYLQQHGIHELFEYLCSQLVYHKPKDPRAFLAKEMRQIQEQRAAGGKGTGSSALSLYTTDDFSVLFRMLDPLNQGALSSKQVAKAVRDLGLDPEKAATAGTLDLKTEDKKYDVQAFTRICQAAQ